MFTISDILLCNMLVCYYNPIRIVYNNYNNNYSISEIITNENIKYNIFFWSILMGIFTLLYEFNRNYISLLIIIFLLFGIIGVIFTEEKRYLLCSYHYFFGTITFLSINSFMLYHSYIKSNNILFILFLFQMLLILFTLKNIDLKIFYYECMLLFNFFIFYMYLHFI